MRIGTGLPLLLLATLTAPLYAQGTGKRMALVIGNDAYSISPLKNAINDAHAMDMALKTAGFQTMVVENAKKAEMDAAIGEFLDKIGPDDIALFFFAGHGVQIESENFLVPVDFAPVATISAAKFACMSVAQIFDELKRKRAKQNIVILDACRTNPVTAKYSLEAGLAKPQDLPKETYLAFSTGPGQVATDNPDGRNSWFTESLADYISQPALTVDIRELFTRVGKRVSDATEGRQVPWNTANLTGRFYFHVPANGDADNDPGLIQKWMDDALAREQRGEWSDAIELVSRVIQRKPGGPLEELAKRKLQYLTARKDAQAQFDAGDYASAANLYEQALKADPFAGDAALQAADSYLLLDQIPKGVAALGIIRQRGTSEEVERAGQMLKQLAAASPEAASEAQASAPQPPPIQELFSGSAFGVPDWAAGTKHLLSASVDISSYTKALKMEVAMPKLFAPSVAVPALADASAGQAATATPAATEPPVATPAAVAIGAAIFHLEVVPAADSRNLKLRGGAPEEFGYVEIEGASADTPVVFDGKLVSTPAKLKVPTGKYEVRTFDGGMVVDTQALEVKPLSIQTIKVNK